MREAPDDAPMLEVKKNEWTELLKRTKNFGFDIYISILWLSATSVYLYTYMCCRYFGFMNTDVCMFVHIYIFYNTR